MKNWQEALLDADGFVEEIEYRLRDVDANPNGDLGVEPKVIARLESTRAGNLRLWHMPPTPRGPDGYLVVYEKGGMATRLLLTSKLLEAMTAYNKQVTILFSDLTPEQHEAHTHVAAAQAAGDPISIRALAKLLKTSQPAVMQLCEDAGWCINVADGINGWGSRRHDSIGDHTVEDLRLYDAELQRQAESHRR